MSLLCGAGLIQPLVYPSGFRNMSLQWDMDVDRGNGRTHWSGFRRILGWWLNTGFCKSWWYHSNVSELTHDSSGSSHFCEGGKTWSENHLGNLKEILTWSKYVLTENSQSINICKIYKMITCENWNDWKNKSTHKRNSKTKDSCWVLQKKVSLIKN